MNNPVLPFTPLLALTNSVFSLWISNRISSALFISSHSSPNSFVLFFGFAGHWMHKFSICIIANVLLACLTSSGLKYRSWSSIWFFSSKWSHAYFSPDWLIRLISGWLKTPSSFNPKFHYHHPPSDFSVSASYEFIQLASNFPWRLFPFRPRLKCLKSVVTHIRWDELDYPSRQSSPSQSDLP